jgi:hypothetical protein
MGVECIIERAGDGLHYAKAGEVVSIHYTLKVGTLSR